MEAAIRSGKPEPAARALAQLSETTRTGGTDWALGIEARCRALLTQGEAAEPFYREAIERRARVELEATGEHPRKRTVETRDDLTPQEAQISRLAADGATNQEIAAQLFISPSTVDYHLRKAFRKLGVKSRHQLTEHLLQPGAHADTAARGN